MKLCQTFLFAISLLAALSVNFVYAQTCQDALDDLTNYAASSRLNHIKFKLSDNRNNMRYVQYTEGKLYYVSDSSGPRLEGDATQYFSDRTWNPGVPNQFDPNYPFNPKATDRVRISIPMDRANPNYGHVTFTLLSWGNGRFTSSSLQCYNGLLYGFIGDSMFILSVQKGKDQAPPR